MANAELSVIFAGPLVTLQDGGRPGNMRYGVPASGPMDRLSFDAAHGALGNAPKQTAIEISLGGLMLQCRQGCVTVAITGGDFLVEHAGQKTPSWTILTLREGENLSIRAGDAGSWAYLAIAATLPAREWLGHTATHSTSGFGGGTLATGQTIVLRDAFVREEREGKIAQPNFLDEGSIRVVLGPQQQHFDPKAADLFVSQPFDVTDAYDRMGMRLNGPQLTLTDALSIASEPIVRGSVQVSGDGVPTVLLADHQTTGGYPKIATVVSSDIDRLVQKRSRQSLRFTQIAPAHAVEIARDHARAAQLYLDQIAVPRGTLAQRLIRENLISGMIVG